MMKLDPIPSYLELPVTGIVNPPVETSAQTLPFGDLTWENFERLCLRLARLERDVEYCQIYGDKGDEQEGIDLYARKNISDKYTVHQCKKSQNFSASKIREAVTKFLEGTWIGRSDTFILCTQESLRGKDRANEIINQSKVLKAKGIKLIPWDKEELSQLLKDNPKIVDDFFGRVWVKAFCGEKIAESLGKKLDAAAKVNLRLKCLSLYRTVFHRQDPGLPLYLSSDQAVIPFEQRYIVPDVNVDKELMIQKVSRRVGEEKEEDSKSDNKNIQESFEYKQRKNAGNWIVEQAQNIVLGEPGSGKSSLLRLIAVDLLSSSPKIAEIARKWGDFLPVWIPFGLWTQQIRRGDGGFKNILKAWLKHWGEEALFDLVDQAIEEKKILLLVDGLDEWTDESAAGLALDQLEVFIDQYKIPVIISSRPQGFERLQFQKAEWSKAKLSDLTLGQQKEICSIWFANKIASLNKESLVSIEIIKKKADREANQFINELNNNADLSYLAKTPLLLCLLLAIRFQNGHLPEDRFKAYSQIVTHFIANHPEKRKRAALVVNERRILNNEELEKVYAFLAYKIQTLYPQGTIEESAAKKLLREYLTDQEIGFGIDTPQATEYIKTIMQFGENSAGILVRKSPTTFGFFHRTCLEFLTAQYISSLSLSEQLKIVKKCCGDPQWKEVLLSLFSLTKKSGEIKAFVDVIKSKKLNLLDRCRSDTLIYEIAFGNFSCSVALARDLAREAFDELQTKPWLPQRKDLMNLIMNGLNSSKVQQMVKDILVTWFPNRSAWRNSLYKSMHGWPLEDVTIETLKKALYDENTDNQREAGQAIAFIAKGDKKIGDYLVSVIYSDLHTSARAAAYESLITGWIDHPSMGDITSKLENSQYPIFRLLAIKVKILGNTHTEKDLKKIFFLGAWRGGVDYEWRGIIQGLLLQGWPNSPEVKKKCLESLKFSNRNDEEKLEREIAESVLLRGFKGDREVAEYCLGQVEQEEHPFLSSGFRDDAWDYIAMNFGDNQSVLDAVDKWIQKQEVDVVPISRAALVVRTESAKKKLFSFLKDHWSFWAADALLEGWGMGDKDVSRVLTKMAKGDVINSSRIGYLIPEIIGDKKKARMILLDLLRDSRCERPDFVIRGLIKLGNTLGDDEVVGLAIERLQKNPSVHYDDLLKSHLIAHYSFSQKVLELARTELELRDGNYPAIATGFKDNLEMRREIIKLVAPIGADLREVIAKRLGENKKDDFSLSLLKQYDVEQDDSVKSATAIAFYKYKIESELNVSKELKQLSKDIICYGPDHDERRQAAFCGLVILRRLDIMVNAKERSGEDRLATVSIKRGADINLPFVNCILENWDYIKTVFGDGFVKRFTKFSGIDDFWDSIAIYADSYNEVSNDLLTLINANELPPTENVLQFLARVKPKSRLLLDYLIKFVNNFESPRNFLSLTQLFAATQVLGANFKNNKEALDKILEGRDRANLSDSLIALVFEAWSGVSVADDLLKLLTKNKTPLSESTYYEIATRYSSSKKLLQDLSKLLDQSKSLNPYISREIHRLMVRRMEIDKDLQKLSIKHLQYKASSSEKISIARLLDESGNTSDLFKRWVSKEIEKQLNEGNLEVGFDLSMGNYGSISRALINI